MKRIIFNFIFLLIFTGCNAPERPPMKLNYSNTLPRKIILFVPGYYGTTLIEKETSRVRWVKVSDFVFSQKGIATTVPGTNIIADTELIPGDILKDVTLVPIIFKIDSYGKTIKALTEFANKHEMIVETVAYDWRDDFINSIKLIDEKIKSLNLTSDDELSVVSHSTGALLMSYYIRYGAQDVDHAVENWEGLKYINKAVLASAPFHGLMVLLRDTEDGTIKSVNKQLMSARDYSSFKSSYLFLPPEGEDIGFNLSDKKEILLGLHKTETWENNKWGLFKFIEDSQRPAARKFISTYMGRSQKFHELLRAKIQVTPPKKIPLFYTWGSGHKTIQNGFVDQNKKIDFTLKESKVDGDGTVTTASARPLDYFNSLNLIVHPTKFSHLKVISDKENQKKIQEFLLLL